MATERTKRPKEGQSACDTRLQPKEEQPACDTSLREEASCPLCAVSMRLWAGFYRCPNCGYKESCCF